MPLKTVAVLACLVALSVAYETEENVIIGTSKNFDEILKAHEFVLVEFYAPWCGHCKSLAPEYAAAATELEASGSPIKLMKVDATVEEDLGSKYDVSGFPTIKLFKNGKASEYNGGRVKTDIIAYLKKKTGPAAEPITTADAADAAKSSNDVSVFGFFESAESAEAKAFVAAAADIELMFFIVTDAAVATHLGATAPAITIFTDFEEEPFKYDGDFTASADVAKFCVGSSVPFVMEFNDQNSQRIFGGSIKTHLLLFANKDADTFDGLVTEMKGAAKEFRGEILFIYIDANIPDNSRISEFFNVSPENIPCVRLINVEGDMAKYKPPTTDITIASLTKFCQDYKDNNLQQDLKSQDTPADWDAKPVKVLTSQNFAEVALDATKDVLVEFYAPWCGHCKQLAPIFEQLAEGYESEADVVIAKMDSTENELADIKIESFPTLKFFPKGAEAEVIDFDGERTLEDMSAFISKQTGKSIKETESADTHEEL